MKFRANASVPVLAFAIALLSASGAGAQYYDYRGEPVRTLHHRHHLTSAARYEREARLEVSRSRDENMARSDQGFTKPPGTAYQIPLGEVRDPKATLASAGVVDEDGNSVGSVQDIKVSPGGQIEGIRISAGGMMGYGAKTVALPNANLRFEPDRNILIAGMTVNQIKALPPVEPNAKSENKNENNYPDKKKS